jgi:hypothetical protein
MKKFFMILTLTIIAALSIAADANNSSFNFINKITVSPKTNLSDDKELKKEFQVKAGGKLNLDLKSGSSISVEGWDKDLLSITVTIEGRDADNVEYSFEQNGNNVKIESDYKEQRKNNKVTIKAAVMVPQKYNVEFSTMGGSVKFNNVNGEFEGQTMGGGFTLTSVKGKAQMKTMGGSIKILNCELDGNIETMGGSIDVDNLVGDLDLSTMGGSIKQNNVKGKSNSGKELNISTMGGAVEVDQAMNGAKVKTMGGPITVNKAAKFVEAETMGGEIEIKEIDGKVKAETMGGNIEVKMVGNPGEGDREVFLKSMGGDITLTVPKNLSMDVEIEIGYDKHNDEVKIKSDFDLKIEKDVVKNKSRKMKYLIGTGSINGGKHKVKIITINGDVYLKKS